MTHPETVRRSFLFDITDDWDVEKAVRSTKMAMQLEGLRNIQAEVSRVSEGEIELFVSGERDA